MNTLYAFTIDETIEQLNKIRLTLGGNAPLILSLTDSELEDMPIIGIRELNGYVELECDHPALKID